MALPYTWEDELNHGKHALIATNFYRFGRKIGIAVSGTHFDLNLLTVSRILIQMVACYPYPEAESEKESNLSWNPF